MAADPATCPQWLLFSELRKELCAAQDRRSRVIGFKITFVSTAIAAIIAYDVNDALLLVPAFASFFFDLLIVGLSVSIKRIGRYCREVLEPGLRGGWSWPENRLLWEEYMAEGECFQWFGLAGNLGLTGLTFIAASIGLFLQLSLNQASVLSIVLAAIIGLDIWVHVRPRRSMRGGVAMRKVPQSTSGPEEQG